MLRYCATAFYSQRKELASVLWCVYDGQTDRVRVPFAVLLKSGHAIFKFFVFVFSFSLLPDFSSVRVERRHIVRSYTKIPAKRTQHERPGILSNAAIISTTPHRLISAT